MTLALLLLFAIDYGSIERRIATGDYRGALAALQSAPETNSARWHLLASKAYDGVNDPEGAVKEAEAALLLEPKNEGGHLQLGQIFLSHNTPGAAFDIFSDALVLFPESLMLRLGRGLAAKELKRPDDAVRDLRECLRRKPGWGIAFDALGSVLLGTYRAEELVAAATEYRDRNPADYRGWYYLAAGRSALDLNDVETERQARESIRLNPRFWSSRGLLGKILMERGETAAAIRELEQAVALRPNDAPTHMSLANAYRLAGRAEDSAREFALVVKLRKQEPDSTSVLIYQRRPTRVPSDR